MRWSRRRRLLGIALVCAGVLLAAEGVLTTVWQEPISSVGATRAQAGLAQDLASETEATRRWAREQAVTKRDRPSARTRFVRLVRHSLGSGRPGRPFGRLIVKRMGLRRVVVFGTGPHALSKGPGLMMNTALPGFRGTTAIAGHRTTHSAPFRHLDDLRRGDRVRLELPYGTFSYVVEGARIIRPDAIGVLRTVGHERLVMYACEPPFSAVRRLAVFARLTESTIVES